MRVTTSERRDEFIGDPYQIVDKMNNSNFVVHADKFEYMEQVARRVRILTHTLISTTDPRTFLYGLQRAGLVNIDFDRYEVD
jgi:hypothetical protein